LAEQGDRQAAEKRLWERRDAQQRAEQIKYLKGLFVQAGTRLASVLSYGIPFRREHAMPDINPDKSSNTTTDNRHLKKVVSTVQKNISVLQRRLRRCKDGYLEL
jgi:hypothetical protein